MAELNFVLQPSVAPFSVASLGNGRYCAKLTDISAYVKQWSGGRHLYVEGSYVAHWLERIGIECREGSVEYYDDEQGTFFVEWESNGQVFHPIAYEEAWTQA
jgi:hypothetical protein